jgi:Cu/Ag efflux protein CusF
MMKLFRVGITAFASAFLMSPAQAQPVKGAPAAFERVREVTTTRFKDVKLAGDPDKDFATMLIAHHEDLIFLAKTQLEYGGDREMRQLAQKLLDAQQREIDDLKQWQVRMRQPDYRAQPDQPPPVSGPLDRKVPVEVAQAPSAPAQPAPARAGAAQDLPMVSGTVEKVDAAAGKITIDHGPIPNLDMDSMTMVFRAQDAAMLKAVKPRDKIRFTADRVNGQITIMKIQRGR